MSTSEGLMIDRYRIEGSVGEGGMAIVYRARHRELGSLHAIKQVKVLNEIVKQRLIQEGRLQSSFTHPNVLSVTDLVTIEDTPALVMEYVDGPALSSFLFEVRPSIEQADYLCRRIIKGVAAAHSHGLIHRDLKPGNILLAITDDAIIPKIADFGLAKALENPSLGQPLTQEGSAMGTPAYMAPEQIQDASMVDARADIFSLGAILYEIVTGQICFGHGSIMEVWDRVCNGDFTPIANLRTDVPARMIRAIEGALQIERNERIADIDDLYRIWCSDDSAEHIPVTGEGYPDFWPKEILHKAKILAPEITPLAGVPGSNISSGASITRDPSEERGQYISPQAETSDSQIETPKTNTDPSLEAAAYAMTRKNSNAMLGYLVTGALVMLLLVAYWGANKFNKEGEPPQASTIQATPLPQKPDDDFALIPSASSVDKSLFKDAVKNLLEGKPTLSHRQFRELQSRRPTSAITNLGLSVTFFFKGQMRRSQVHAKRAQSLSESQETKRDMLINLAAASLNNSSKANVKEWQRLRDNTKDPLFELLYLMSCRKVLGAELVTKQISKAQKQYPKMPIFSLLELHLLTSQHPPGKLVSKAESLRKSFPQSNDILLFLADSLYQTRQYDKAEVHLTNILLSEPLRIEAHLQLARLAIVKNRKDLRTRQLLAAMSDSIPTEEQLDYLRYHGLHLYEQGQLSEALKTWDFCIRQAGKYKEPFSAQECHRLGTRAIIRLENFSELENWLTKAEEIISNTAEDTDYNSLFSMTRLWAKITLAVRAKDLSLAEALLIRLKKSDVPANNISDKERVVALNELKIASIKPETSNPDPLTLLKRELDSPASCAEIYEQTKAATKFLSPSELQTRLVTIATKNCQATEEHHVIKALAHANLAQTYLTGSNSAEARRSLEAFKALWPHPEKTLPSVNNVSQVERSLAQ